MATTTSIIVNIKQDPIEVIIHEPKMSTKTKKVSEREKATFELLAFHPEIFEDGVLQDVSLTVPYLTPTDAAIVMEAAPIITKWKDFMIFIFKLFPHDSVSQNVQRIEYLWPYVLLLQGKDPDSEEE